MQVEMTVSRPTIAPSGFTHLSTLFGQGLGAVQTSSQVTTDVSGSFRTLFLPASPISKPAECLHIMSW